MYSGVAGRGLASGFFGGRFDLISKRIIEFSPTCWTRGCAAHYRLHPSVAAIPVGGTEFLSPIAFDCVENPVMRKVELRR